MCWRPPGEVRSHEAPPPTGSSSPWNTTLHLCSSGNPQLCSPPSYHCSRVDKEWTPANTPVTTPTWLFSAQFRMVWGLITKTVPLPSLSYESNRKDAKSRITHPPKSPIGPQPHYSPPPALGLSLTLSLSHTLTLPHQGKVGETEQLEHVEEPRGKETLLNEEEARVSCSQS